MIRSVGENTGPIMFDACCTCSPHYLYIPPGGGGTVEIIKGVSREGSTYKAISHVWGEVVPFDLQCRKCNGTGTFPLRSFEAFDHMMALVGFGSVWVDILSIDQADHDDTVAQLAVMGNIFCNAQCVSVLLPPTDQGAFALLLDLTHTAKAILVRRDIFTHSYQGRNPHGSQCDDCLYMGQLVQRFYTSVAKLDRDLNSWVYWRRAWTFQEWALAQDLEIALEGPSIMAGIRQVKQVVLDAGLLLSQYRLQNGQYGSIKYGINKGEIAQRFNVIKRLFPCEARFLSTEEVDADGAEFQAMFTALMGTDQLLGLRSTPVTDPAIRCRTRLSTMLDAFGSTKREAHFEADLILSWASMCNISYAYRKDDSFAVALHKILIELRSRGIAIHNFLVNAVGAGAEVDLHFFDYATAHRQCNATNGAPFPGAPIFTGIADIATHLQNLITPDPTHSLGVPLTGSGVPPRKIAGPRIGFQLLDDVDAFKETFGNLVSGKVDGLIFTDAVDAAAAVLQRTPPAQLAQFALVIVDLPIAAAPDKFFYCWSVVPVYTPFRKLFVAREALNGTLSLALELPGDAAGGVRAADAVGYVVIADHQSGVHLVKADEAGWVDMILRTPHRGDIVFSGLIGTREIHLSIEFEAGGDFLGF